MSRKTPGEVRARTCGTKSPSRSEALRFIDSSKSPSTCDLDESIKRSASDRLGDLVPQVRARTSPGVFRDMALLGLCLELSFKVSFVSFLYFATFLFRTGTCVLGEAGDVNSGDCRSLTFITTPRKRTTPHWQGPTLRYEYEIQPARPSLEYDPVPRRLSTCAVKRRVLIPR